MVNGSQTSKLCLALVGKVFASMHWTMFYWIIGIKCNWNTVKWHLSACLQKYLNISPNLEKWTTFWSLFWYLTAVECPEPSTPVSASFVQPVMDRGYGSTYSVVCDEGYYIDNSVLYATHKCSFYGAWEPAPESVTCRRKFILHLYTAFGDFKSRHERGDQATAFCSWKFMKNLVKFLWNFFGTHNCLSLVP